MSDILAVIPCFNEEAYIESVVEKLVDDCQDLSINVVIADGGSTDRTPEIARSLSEKYDNVLYLHNPKKIQSAAVNLAVEKFGKDATYLIRLDAHAEYPNDYCKTLVDEQNRTGATSIVVSMDTVGVTPFQKAVAAAQNSKLGNGGSPHRLIEKEGRWVDHGHHALMVIEAFVSVGGYDEDFSHNEDYELDYRLRKKGGKIWLTGKTKMIYYPRRDAVSLFLQYYNFGQGVARMVQKHHNRLRLRQLIPAAIVPAVLFALLTPVFPLAAVPVTTWILFCLVYGVILACRTRELSTVVSGLAAMIMHIGWSSGFLSFMVFERK